MYLSARLTSIALSLMIFVSVNQAQPELKYKELPNFHKINEQLYRGAQPKPCGFKRLASLGIRTVINLRADDDRSRAEAKEVVAAGMSYFNIPLKNLGRPTDEQIRRVRAIINSRENQPVFVHCKRGADRTGTVIAIYRIDHDGWTSEKAKAEAKRYGMAFWQRGMKQYVRDYYQTNTPIVCKGANCHGALPATH